MNFNFLKFQKDKTPSLGSLRPKTFATEKLWFCVLAVCFAVFLVTAFIGLRLFYSQYFETYKDKNSEGTPESPVNIERLQNIIGKRKAFMEQEVSIPRDPSL